MKARNLGDDARVAGIAKRKLSDLVQTSAVKALFFFVSSQSHNYGSNIRETKTSRE